MQTRTVEYQSDGMNCKGFMAFDDSESLPGPTVFMVPPFDGVTDFTKDYAKRVAALGYVVFVPDLYGDGQTRDEMDACMALIMPYLENRVLARTRMLEAFEVAKQQPEVDADKMAALGFCSGGMCALELARAGADLKGLVSLHGAFAPTELAAEKIKAKLLFLHGYDDPQVPPDALPALAKELNEQGVDWQFVFFSQTKHSFTDPIAAEIGSPEAGRVYSKRTAERAFQYSKDFFAEIFE